MTCPKDKNIMVPTLMSGGMHQVTTEAGPAMVHMWDIYTCPKCCFRIMTGFEERKDSEQIDYNTLRGMYGQKTNENSSTVANL